MTEFINEYQHILESVHFGNSIEKYCLALGIFLVLFIVLRFFRSQIIHRLKKLAQQTSTEFDDHLVISMEKIHPRFYDFISLYIAIQSLAFPDEIDKIIYGAFIVLVIFQAIISSEDIVLYFLKKAVTDGKTHTTADDMAFHGLSLFVKIILWATGSLLILSNLGFNITSLAASLGIGGIAVALAVQNILSDIFSSFTIYFDKPFEIGDFIIIGTEMGTVQKIGLKTTRIKALQGEELVVSNKELTSARIQNFKKMQQRRIVFTLGITYDTSLEKCKKIPIIIEEIFSKLPDAQFARAHFFEFADFSLNYEIVYHQLSGDYDQYMDTRQSLNFAIKEAFEAEGIEMAFPTQTIHVQQ